MLNILHHDESITIDQIDFTNSIESMQKSRDLRLHKQQIHNNKKSTESQKLAAKLDSIVTETTLDIYFNICYISSKRKSLIIYILYMAYVL